MKKKYLILLISVGALLVLSSLYTAVKVSVGSSEVLMGATTKIKLTDPNSVTPYATSTPTANLIPIAPTSTTVLADGWQTVSQANATDLTDSGTTTLHSHTIYNGSWEETQSAKTSNFDVFVTTTVGHYPNKITVYGWTGLSDAGGYPASWNNLLGNDSSSNQGAGIGLWVNGSTYGNNMPFSGGAVTLADNGTYLFNFTAGGLYSRLSVHSVSATQVVLKWSVLTASGGNANDVAGIKIRYTIE